MKSLREKLAEWAAQHKIIDEAAKLESLIIDGESTPEQEARYKALGVELPQASKDVLIALKMLEHRTQSIREQHLKDELLELAETFYTYTTDRDICSNCGEKIQFVDACSGCGAPDEDCFDFHVYGTCARCLGCEE